MNIETHIDSGALVLTVRDAVIDAMVAQDFSKQLIDQVAENDVLIVDLGAVRMMDSSGLGALVSARKALADSGRVLLASPQPAVLKVLELTRLSLVFPVFPTVEAATEALQTLAQP